MSVDEEAVRAANRAFYRAFESLDLTRMAEVWADHDPQSCIHPDGSLAAGREAVLGTWRTIFANTPQMSFEVQAERIEVSGDLAWVVCTEVLRASSSGGAPEGAVQATNVFRREAKGWKVVHHHASPFFLAEPPSPPRAAKGFLH